MRLCGTKQKNVLQSAKEQPPAACCEQMLYAGGGTFSQSHTMHLPDGVMPLPVCGAGYAACAVATAAALRSLPERDVPRLALMAAGFFVLGALHVRIGPGSVHFLLTGLMAIVVGWRAVAAVSVGVFLHALLLQHGGLTTVGVNACVLGLPPMLVGFLAARIRRSDRLSLALAGAGATVACYVLSMALLWTVVGFAEGATAEPLRIWVAAHLPVMALEAVVTAAAVVYVGRVDRKALVLCSKVDAS